ncbi:AAA domain-containing protein, partial [Candidatus Dependentiae bacterium]|nr:AAA domain-containing protein [Candidatus Dependentiae bacterium]
MPKIDCNKLQDQLWKDGILLNRGTIMGMCAALNTDKNMMFSGVPGTAKTSTAKSIAKALFDGTEKNKYNAKFHRITAAPGITRQEFFGDWNYHKQFLEIQAGCSNNVCNSEDIIDSVYREENFIPG